MVSAEASNLADLSSHFRWRPATKHRIQNRWAGAVRGFLHMDALILGGHVGTSLNTKSVSRVIPDGSSFRRIGWVTPAQTRGCGAVS